MNPPLNIKKIFPAIENALHRFTHGDAHQISRRLSQRPDGRPPGFNEADVISILSFTTRMTLYAMIAMFDHGRNEPGCEQIRLRLLELDRLDSTAAKLLEAIYGPPTDFT